MSSPPPFKAVFEPRSERAREVIEREWQTAEKDVDVLLNSIREQQVAMGMDVHA